MLLEVIATSIEDVIDINNTVADRIELCESLECGGLTPNRELIMNAGNVSKIPVNVIIRTNESWDFVFTKEEQELMLSDIEWISKNTKCNGVVVGVLLENGEADFSFLNKVNKIKGKLQLTFHKAFDQLKNKLDVWNEFEKLNITNVLTSGEEFLVNGFSTLNEISKVRKNTNLLIGGGVTLDNIAECLKYSDNIHIGTAARTEKTWVSKISPKNIELFKTAR